MSEFETLSNAMAGAVETAAASVVTVDARKRMPATGIVWSADGVIVTAAHVVTREDRIGVALPGGERLVASLVGRDAASDLAVLRVDSGGLAVPRWVGETDLRVGQMVLALGRAGEHIEATLGVISALADRWRTPAGAVLEHYVQTDVTMYPGFSGGPLVTASGALAGLNTSALFGGRVSITLHAATLRRIVGAILEHGAVRRGYLGVGSQPVRLPEALAQQIGQETALLLISVEPGSPADAGGLLMGDTIVTLAGDPIRHMDDLHAALTGDRVGQSVPVRIVRGGQLQEVQVTIGARQ